MDSAAWIAVGAASGMGVAGITLTAVVVKALWLLAKELNAINVHLTTLNGRIGHSEAWQLKREGVEDDLARQGRTSVKLKP